MRTTVQVWTRQGEDAHVTAARWQRHVATRASIKAAAS
jgi:hypothetical protein